MKKRTNVSAPVALTTVTSYRDWGLTFGKMNGEFGVHGPFRVNPQNKKTLPI
jgi:hypothetical protein